MWYGAKASGGVGRATAALCVPFLAVKVCIASWLTPYSLVDLNQADGLSATYPDLAAASTTALPPHRAKLTHIEERCFRIFGVCLAFT